MELLGWGGAWVLLTALTACRGLTEAEEDEKRPYKFAFAIEGYQHRSEEKDERGIIMGEFGFVTGDGVYHVTVYATDENGNFKILKMKNYYIGLPGEGTTAAPSRAAPPTTRATTTPPPPPPPPTPSTTKNPILQHLEGLMGCSNCRIPQKSTQSPGAVTTPSSSPGGEGLIDVRFGGEQGVERPGSSKPTYNGKPISGQTGKSPSGGFQNALGSGGSKPSSPGGAQPFGGSRPVGGAQINSSKGSQLGYTPQQPGQGSTSKNPSGGFGPPSISGSPSYAPGADRSGDLGPPSRGSPNALPGSIPSSNQPPRQADSPSPDGLPPGMTQEDLMDLLYKFNYTLRFHGHHESGYRNGDKEGGYFFNGKDGLGRKVDYVANEFGFQPNITLEELGLQHPDTPNNENEKMDELRGNEFKWFYNR